jgi:hypothetical protein
MQWHKVLKIALALVLMFIGAFYAGAAYQTAANDAAVPAAIAATCFLGVYLLVRRP